ncbi:MAG: TraR/DksA family transcriptional regulator [Patescibacteria group bacterium]
MTPDELNKLDAELVVKEKALVAQLEEIASKNPVIPGDYEPKMPNYGRDDEENINEAAALPEIVAMTDALERQLKEVRETRNKIRMGTYGTCSNCGSPIAPKRLQALSTAILCIDCVHKLT